MLSNQGPIVHLESNSVTKKEVLQLVLNWMVDQGYTASAQVLREEASSQHRGEQYIRKLLATLTRSIEEHNWESATKSIKRIQQYVSGDESVSEISGHLSYLTRVLPFLLVQQQFLETIGSDDDGIRAYTFFVKSIKPLETMLEREHFKKLNYLLTCKSVSEAAQLFPEYRSWSPGIGSAQLIAFINKSLSDLLLNSAYITNSLEDHSTFSTTKSLDTYLEEALSYQVIRFKYPKIHENIDEKTVVTSLTGPLFDELPALEPFTALDISALLNPSGDRKIVSVTACCPVPSIDFFIVGCSTGDVLLVGMDALNEKTKGSVPENYANIVQFSDAVRGVCCHKKKVFVWGGHKAALIDIGNQSSSKQLCNENFTVQMMYFEVDVSCGCLLPPETISATGHSDGTVAMWDTLSGERLYQNNFTTTPITSLIVNRSGTVYYSGSQDGIIRAVDTVTGILLFSLVPPILMELSGLCLSPSSTRLLSSYRGGSLRLWDTVSGHEIAHRFSTAETTKRRASLSFGNVDDHIYCGTDNGSVLFWDTSIFPQQKESLGVSNSLRALSDASNSPVGVQYPTRVLNMHRAPVNDIKALGRFLFSVGEDGCLCICRSQTSE